MGRQLRSTLEIKDAEVEQHLILPGIFSMGVRIGNMKIADSDRKPFFAGPSKPSDAQGWC